jgi:hypothetical protein
MKLDFEEVALLNIRLWEGRYKASDNEDLLAQMIVVKLNATWQQYAEDCLTFALVRHPKFFLDSNNISRMRSVPKSLASLLVRGGRNRYFDFKDTRDLIKKGDDNT